jgi:DNA-binding transcriptional MerR regulator
MLMDGAGTSGGAEARLLTVGQLARRSGLTAKALRHYDRVGLLSPALIDSVNGYRRYRLEQLPHATLVRVLRELDVPLDDIRGLGADPSAAAVSLLLRAHRVRLEAELVSAQRKLHHLDHVSNEGWQTMADIDRSSATLDDDEERTLGAALFNAVWTWLEKANRSADDDLLMVHMAHASAHHWAKVGEPVNRVRSEWQCSRVYASVRRPEPALFHAQRALAICESNGITGFDLGFCYEALARAHSVSGDSAEAKRWQQRGYDEAKSVEEDDDRELLLADLGSVAS